MKYKTILLSLLLIPGYCLSQVAYVAPDLRNDDQVRSFLGFCNPNDADNEISITGYESDGSFTTVTLTLAKNARFETSPESIFPERQVVWAKIEADLLIGGYVRYRHTDGKRSSLVGLVRSTDQRLWVPQLDEAVEGTSVWISRLNNESRSYDPETVFVNVSEQEGGLRLDPIILNEADGFAYQKVADPPLLEDFGAPFQKIRLRHGRFFKEGQAPLWDAPMATGGARVAGVQQYLDESGQRLGMATLGLTRTPYRNMFFGPLENDKRSFWNLITLINTHPGPMNIEITGYYDFGMSHKVQINMAAYQKLIFNIHDVVLPFDLPGNAHWFKVQPFEGGLLGYQMFGSNDGHVLAATEAAPFPAGNVVLPYTPTTDSLQTKIGIINTSPDEKIWVTAVGYNDEGRRMATKIRIRLNPGEKMDADAETLFGDKARDISWVRIGNNRAALVAYAVIRARDGSRAAALQGVGMLAKQSRIFEADFEHVQDFSLDAQGWSGSIVDEPLRPLTGRPHHFGSDSLSDPNPGSFFVDHAFNGESGYFYLGYEPLYSEITTRILDGGSDAVIYRSPLIEIPAYGDYFLSFYMKFHNPDLTTPESNYGMVWREEGSSQWQWFGLQGIILLDPPLAVSDCWVRVPWRNFLTEITGWIPFETPLPADLRGKRIQVGYYYHFRPDAQTNEAPYMFIDKVRISNHPLKRSFHFGIYGSGSLNHSP